MVECGSQVEQAVPNQNPDTIRYRIGFRDADASGYDSVSESIRRHFRVILIDDQVGFSFVPTDDVVLERLEVFSRPV